MTAPRTSAAELARAGRRGVARVCAGWPAADHLYERCLPSMAGRASRRGLGQECRYHCVADAAGEVPVAGLLCPPPEAFAGQTATAEITLERTTAGTPDWSRVEFIPLAGEGNEPAAVLAIVAAQPRDGSKPDALNGESTAQLHLRLQPLLATRHRQFGSSRLVGESAVDPARASAGSAAAGSQAATLIVGPAGSGRRRLAHALHDSCPQSQRGPLVPLACGLLNAELLLAGAEALRRGKPAAAVDRNGTLLLEEADQLPAESQAALANLLQSADQPPRLLATSKRQLIEMAEAGLFRRDLALR